MERVDQSRPWAAVTGPQLFGRLAQLLLFGVVASMFLPWSRTESGQAATEGATNPSLTVQGVDVNEGVLVLVVAVLTIGLVQVGLRPAWMGAGFITAVIGRQLFAGPADMSPGIGAIVGFLAAVVALGLLLTSLAREIGPPPASTQ